MFENQSLDQQQIEKDTNANNLLADVQDFRTVLPALDTSNSMPAGCRRSQVEQLDLKSPFPAEKNAEKIKLSETESLPPIDGKVTDITGRGITDRFGVTATDLGVSIIGPDGKLVSVFGDTFSGDRVGEGDWRSPVALKGSGDADHKIQFDAAVGADSQYAKQIFDYKHEDPRKGGEISTIIPDDLLRVGDKMYMHGIVNQGFGNVIRTGIWESADNGKSWELKTEFPGGMDKGYSQCWSWDYNPDDGYVYIASTGFQRDKGIVLHRVRPEDITNPAKYSGWGFANGKWSWDQEPTCVTPPGETWGELSLRRLGSGQWLLGGFLASEYALGYRTIGSPTADLYKTPLQLPVVGSRWENEDHAHNRVAQLYGGFILPGSKLDEAGGVGLVVSQWNTSKGQPYKAMQFTVTLQNTIGKATPEPEPKNPTVHEDRPVYNNDEYVRFRRQMEQEALKARK